MQVAVAGVKDVAYAQVVAAADVRDHAQNPRQTGPRNDPVLGRVVWREAPDRSESPFARFPQQRPFGFVAREPDARSAGRAHNFRDLIGISRQPSLETFKLDD